MSEKVAPVLSAHDRERYGWQLDIDGFGEAAQARLRQSTVLISRLGGVGGTAAMQLAAAGVGRLVLAHGGDLRLDDMNRQMLMSTDAVGHPRMESIVRRLREINPTVELVAESANASAGNIARLAEEADLIIDAAPLFEERYLLNEASIRRGIPMVEAAMYDMEIHVTTFVPGQTPCLRCFCPEIPAWWKRRFPVFGAVASTAGCLAATEALKVLGAFGKPLLGRMLHLDLGTGTSRTLQIARDPRCPTCHSTPSPPPLQ